MLGTEVIKYIIDNKLENETFDIILDKCVKCSLRYNCDEYLEFTCKENNFASYSD